MTRYDSVKLTHKINHHSIFQAPNFCLVLFFFNLYFYWYSHFVHTSFSGFYLVICPCSILLHWAPLGQRCFKFLRKTEAWISFRSISELFFFFEWVMFLCFFEHLLKFCWKLGIGKNRQLSQSLQLSSLGDFPAAQMVMKSACNAGDLGSVPGVGRSSGEGNGNPLQCSCLENSMIRGT